MDPSEIILMDPLPISKVKRMRKANFTDAEVRMLLDGVASQKELLQSNLLDTITNRRKQLMWQKICEKVNTCGVATRTPAELREKWGLMKRMASTRKVDERQTGEGQPQPAQKYEDIVLSILGDGHGVPAGVPDGQLPASLPVKSAQQPRACPREETGVHGVNSDMLNSDESDEDQQLPSTDHRTSSFRQETPQQYSTSPELPMSSQKRNLFNAPCESGTLQEEDLFKEYMLNRIKESKLQQEKLRLEVMLLQRQVAENDWTVVQAQYMDDDHGV